MTALAAAESPSRASTVQKVVSRGGVEAWLVEDYAIPLVALEFAFKGGATQDPIGKPGAAMLLSGLLDEGAGAYDSEGFHRALDENAIEMSFSADRDVLTGRMQSLSRNSARAFALLQLAVTEARLDADSFERVVSQIVARLKREANDPDFVAGRSLRALAYPNHPYGQPVRGELSTLPTLTRANLIEMRAMTFASANLRIAAVGAIDAAALAGHLEDVFGRLPEEASLNLVVPAVFSGTGTRHVDPIDV